MVDSGASHHMCNDRQAFRPNSLYPANHTIRLGDRTTVTATSKGTISLAGFTIEALFVPAFRVSLLSVSELDKLGWTSTFTNGSCSLSDPYGTILFRIGIADGLYKFNPWQSIALITTRSAARAIQDQPHQQPHPSLANRPAPVASKPSSVTPAPSAAANPPSATPRMGSLNRVPSEPQPATVHLKPDNFFEMWHRRLAHLHHDALPKALSGVQAYGTLSSPCEVCIRSQLQQKFERAPSPRSESPFELVHSDLAGPFEVSIGGAAYYIIYVADYTRFVEVFFLVGKTAAEICAKFVTFKASVETRGFRIKRFRCDNGTGEYNNKNFLQILSASGTAYEPSPPYTQHKNGVSERMICTLNTKARSMLLDVGLPMRFWAEAVRTVAYLHRRTPTTRLPGHISPHQALLGSHPALSHLKRFGCKVYRHLPREQRSDKFSDWARPCMMLGYVHHTTRIWRIWDFSLRGRGGAIKSSNVRFMESLNAYGAPVEPADIVYFPGPVMGPGDLDELDGKSVEGTSCSPRAQALRQEKRPLSGATSRIDRLTVSPYRDPR